MLIHTYNITSFPHAIRKWLASFISGAGRTTFHGGLAIKFTDLSGRHYVDESIPGACIWML